MTQFIIILVYLAMLLVLGLAANRMFKGTSADYFLAQWLSRPFSTYPGLAVA